MIHRLYSLELDEVPLYSDAIGYEGGPLDCDSAVCEQMTVYLSAGSSVNRVNSHNLKAQCFDVAARWFEGDLYCSEFLLSQIL